MDEAAGEGDKPDEGEQHREGCDDLGVDEAPLRPRAGVIEPAEITTDQAGDGLIIKRSVM